MSDLFSDLTSVIDNFGSVDNIDGKDYLYFEPFDCLEPDPETIAKAAEDGVNLYGDDIEALCGTYPRKFQSGALLSKKKIVSLLAASRVGKSILTEVLMGAAISRQPPYCMRYEEGVDTNIARDVTPLNIRRFGRRDKASGIIIDYNESAILDLKSWDCGNIIGIGLFPEEKYVPDGGSVWLATLARSIDTHWWRRLAGTGKERFLPKSFLDMSKGNNGTNRQRLEIHFNRDISLFIKSYDADRKTLESDKPHILVWDEEPLKPEHYISGQGHCVHQYWSFTALNGISFTKPLFFGCISQADKDRGKRLGIGSLKRDDFDFFQASAYDSPYIDLDVKDKTRNAQPEYSRRSITWGRYGANSGDPFFSRSKLEKWQRSHLHPHRKVTMKPETAYDGWFGHKTYGTKGLMDVKILTEKADDDDLRNVWRIYENPQPNEAYLFAVDSAAGAVDPKESQDFNFSVMFRRPNASDPIQHFYHPIIVATIRSTLTTIAFAKYTAYGLRYYNNAVLAAERGHGSANEAYGITMDEYPYWYYNKAQNDSTKNYSLRKGFDTHVGTRDPMLGLVREWLDDFEENEDPYIRDSWLYDELAGAVTKEHANGKKRCDHTKDGYMDGVICLGIGTFIFNNTPEVFVCNETEEAKKPKQGLMARMLDKQTRSTSKKKMGAGIGRTTR